MTTDKTKNSHKTTVTFEKQPGKEELNKKTSVQFVTSVTVGVLIIVLLAAGRILRNYPHLVPFF